MGTNLNGEIQTILNSYKSAKISNKIESEVSYYSDCDLTRSVISGKTIGGQYRNIKTDSSGNLWISIKNPIDAFGSISMTQPQQFTEIMFLHNYLNPLLLLTENLNTGNISISNNICKISSGVSTNGKSAIITRRRCRYVPGLAIVIRFSAIFSSPIVGGTQIIGYGDECNGLFFGYKDMNFGILHRTKGDYEIRTLTINTTSNIDDTITITLNGISSSLISILATDNKQQIAKKILANAAEFSTLENGWNLSVQDNKVIFISRNAKNMTGDFLYTPTSGTSAGSFSITKSGTEPEENWILQNEWNKDNGRGGYDMVNINPQKGNVFEISMQWLGFGCITFKMENPINGGFDIIHQIRYANSSNLTSIENPNLPLYASASKTGNNSTDEIFVKTASMGLFIMGEYNKTLGVRTAVSSILSTTNTQTLNTGTYYNVITLINSNVFNATRNYREVYALAFSVCLNTGINIKKGGIFTFLVNAVLDNSTELTWSQVNSTVAVYQTKNTVSVSGGLELLSVPLPPNNYHTMSVTDLEFYVLPGSSITIAFKPYENYTNLADNSAEISFSVSWIQQ
jgi:hypothetical protein